MQIAQEQGLEQVFVVRLHIHVFSIGTLDLQRRESEDLDKLVYVPKGETVHLHDKTLHRFSLEFLVEDLHKSQLIKA